ncbi:Gfo/Idh/MocA family protein [Steroidobacter sp.]|uniref:Gfo/Idh/MocA family protein n=1 Tax=Steroidobacter sp. TaxID=1978227 RepID=UPI001A4602D5|nr:Gfo/Idh/MocA family oxidoreductase [Steroidobacter sp.]MBL8266305.1 Gfo/Idh/MocA family oxidoreductase [Steroidobacter sp.]
MKTTRIGFIGTGAVAQVHAEAYRALAGVELAACYDLDPARADAFARTHSAQGYSDLAAMLSSANLDIACVLTPARAHEAAVIACANAGVHVLCEKPLALSLDACDRMIRACEQAGVSLAYGASYRFLPAVVTAKQLIDAGEIGDILLMREAAVGGSGIERRETLSEAHFPAGGPGGSGMGLIDHGIHLVDLFSWLAKSPVTRVRGRGNIAGQKQLPEYLMLEYDNGALGELVYEDGTFPSELPTEGIFSGGSGWDVGGITPPGQWQAHPGSIHIHGSRGSLRIFHYANALYLRNQHGVREIKVPEPGAPIQFALQLQAFIDSIRAGLPPPVPASAGREACRLVLSVYGEHS